ncbi:DUF2717 domain-containing protein [Yersinia phage phiA1122]|uniref:Phage protein n=5 Tax=Teseptimavirus TaxID=110456 RepID=I6Q9Y8_9CAUD|nr:DUF2717 domain-containing protein [Yersinia phage phiA1122]YP_009799251.1 DUF2717 domain-containing protein [Yersinia phage YpP-Y]YP_009799303.1 DUF2717 domain-containing protein [Yersinia phage YpsP-G]AFK13421.1 hypothetical protein [Yersinia phage YpP-R]AGC35488.1 hypothetical protein Y_27 [Yersinia phage Y]WMX18692.1 hypothetical protein YpYe09_21 [Yersinia phage vB_YpYeO9]AAP20525.1 protein 6.5 [Yersinia phage phiA1122]AFK13369.1 hypothetical protein [Yersinia phage YpP-Y]
MLTPISQLLKNPNDIPDVPRATAEYLQVRFNHAYLEASGHIGFMRASGCSEAHILGFIQGLQYASNIIDEIELRKEQLRDDGED